MVGSTGVGAARVSSIYLAEEKRQKKKNKGKHVVHRRSSHQPLSVQGKRRHTNGHKNHLPTLLSAHRPLTAGGACVPPLGGLSSRKTKGAQTWLVASLVFFRRGLCSPFPLSRFPLAWVLPCCKHPSMLGGIHVCSPLSLGRGSSRATYIHPCLAESILVRQGNGENISLLPPPPCARRQHRQGPKPPTPNTRGQ